MEPARASAPSEPPPPSSDTRYVLGLTGVLLGSFPLGAAVGYALGPLLPVRSETLALATSLALLSAGSAVCWRGLGRCYRGRSRPTYATKALIVSVVLTSTGPLVGLAALAVWLARA